jgi:hypothetical protein
MAEALEQNSENTVLPYEKMAEYNKLTADIKTLEAKKDKLNKELKKEMGLYRIGQLKLKFQPYEDLIIEYLDLLSDKDPESQDRLIELERELSAVGFDIDIWDMIQKNDHAGILKTAPAEYENNKLLARFSVQDRSKLDPDKTVEYLKGKGLQNCIIMKEVPDEQAIEKAIFDGKITPRDFKVNCINEQIVVALTVGVVKDKEE